MRNHNLQKRFSVDRHDMIAGPSGAGGLDMWPGDEVTVAGRSVWVMTATGKLEFLRCLMFERAQVRKAG